MQFGRVVPALLAAACAFGGAQAVTVGTAAAAPAANFYTPPASLPSGDGQIIRTEPMSLLTTIPAINGPWPGTAQRVMYTSQLQDGSPTAVTGTYLQPSRPWTGNGPQPTIVIGSGTIGQGDQCAPSKNFPLGFQITGQPALPLPASISMNYEIMAADAWNAAGARVFMTDYIGLGTPGIHTYVNRAEEGHAMLDAARAANNLSKSGDQTPIAFWGYSQGGGAAASAAELAGTYAPELNVRGTYAGAPPADLKATLGQIDGNLIGGAIGFAINGFIARKPELKTELDKRITPAGQDVLNQLAHSCIADVILQHPFLKTSSLTRNGKSMLENMKQIPAAMKMIDDQRIGRRTPTAPVLVVSGRNDDVVPYGQARQLAKDWCARGATVSFVTDELPPIFPGLVINHGTPMVIDSFRPGGAMSFVTDRINGVPLKGCAIN